MTPRQKTFCWSDAKHGGRWSLTATHWQAGDHERLNIGYDDGRDFTSNGIPLNVLKDIVDWAYAGETITIAQQAVREFAAEHGMTETGKSEGRVYGRRVNVQNIPKKRDETHAFFSSGTPSPYYQQAKDMEAAGDWTLSVSTPPERFSRSRLGFREALREAIRVQPNSDPEHAAREDVFIAMHKAFEAKTAYEFGDAACSYVLYPPGYAKTESDE